jgi:hypothetical protein
MKQTYSILMFWLYLNVGSSQVLLPLQADRPDQTESPFLVPSHYLQVENGFTYEKKNINESSFAYPSILWKYGVNTHFELRLITELLSEQNVLKKTKGMTPLTIGFKTSLTEESGFLPKTSFIGHLSLKNTGVENYRTPYYAPSFRFLMQHQLTENCALAYNIGAEWDGISAEPRFLYTLTTGIPLSDKLSGYIELYGFVPQQAAAEHQADGGFTYMVNDNLMLDLSGGWGLTETAPIYFLSFGLSYRFDMQKQVSAFLKRF